MKIMVDTSALYALMDRDDQNHESAKQAWSEIIKSEHTLISSNYILVETFALLQSWLGLKAVRGFHEDLMPLIHVEFVSSTLHRLGIAALLAVSKRRLSLVDCVSFEVMRASGIKTAFAFDAHFAEQGFDLIP
jgi:predicted nucleic acid-binding protein